MPYATRVDLERLALPAAALAGIPAADQDAALEAASDLADSYLRARYTLPLVAWEDDLRRAVAAIAAYDLMVRRGFSPTGADEQLRLRYEDALRWLERVAAGQLHPQIVDSSPVPETTEPIGYTAPPRGWCE